MHGKMEHGAGSIQIKVKHGARSMQSKVIANL